MDQLRSSSFRFIGNLFILLLLLLIPSTKIFKSICSVFNIFGFSSKTFTYSINTLIVLVLFSIGYEFLVIIRELSTRMFAHKKDSSSTTSTTIPLQKPIPLYTTPLKDSYTNNNTTRTLKSGAGSMSSNINLSQSPLKFTPSPKISERERVNSPLSIPLHSDTYSHPSPSSKGNNLSSWTAALDLHLNKGQGGGGLSRESSDSFGSKKDGSNISSSSLSGVGSGGKSDLHTEPVSKQSKLLFERDILNPEIALQYCNMSSDWDVYIENMRGWFIHKILLPLSQQITQVDQAFESAGLSHLSSRFPATYSMAAKSLDGEHRMRSHLFLSAPSASFNEPKIQSLLDLVHSRPTDPLVKSRLRIEKYLSIATISSHRASLIKKIANLADGSFMNSFHSTLFMNNTSETTTTSTSTSRTNPNTNNTTSTSSTSEPFDDSQVLLHLFCTFMDENLPSENANDSQPFTSNFFVPIDEKVSNRRDAIQIQQISSTPLTLQLIAESRILQAHPGCNNIFEIILFLVDFVHRNRRGYLGIGNLDSKNIDLISVLRK